MDDGTGRAFNFDVLAAVVRVVEKASGAGEDGIDGNPFPVLSAVIVREGRA